MSDTPNKSALREEARAWREVARRIAQRGELRASGLCFEVTIAANEDYAIPGEPAFVKRTCEQSMDVRLIRHLDGASYLEGDDYEMDGHVRLNTRILACLLLALECDDEARSLTPERRPSRRKP